MNNSISINKQVKPLVEQLIESHEKLNLSIRRWLEFQLDSKDFIVENN